MICGSRVPEIVKIEPIVGRLPAVLTQSLGVTFDGGMHGRFAFAARRLREIGQRLEVNLVTVAAQVQPGHEHGRPAQQRREPDVDRRRDPIDRRNVLIQRTVDGANAAVSRAEQVRRFIVLMAVPSEDDRTLTPTLKLRRTEFLNTVAHHVHQLYQGENQS